MELWRVGVEFGSVGAGPMAKRREFHAGRPSSNGTWAGWRGIRGGWREIQGGGTYNQATEPNGIVSFLFFSCYVSISFAVFFSSWGRDGPLQHQKQKTGELLIEGRAPDWILRRFCVESE